MSVPRIDSLRLENWQNTTSIQNRLDSLQKLENAIATQEHRDPCRVQFISEEKYETPEDHQNLYGYHEGKEIFVNENLVTDNTPYLATETLFHEARHDYQQHLVDNPDLANDSKQLQDFQMNMPDGYLNSEDDGYPKYRWQPIEMDANQVARQRTEELYTSEFGDETLYPEHRQEMEKALAKDIEIGQVFLGDNYIEQARDAMIAQYQQAQSSKLQNGVTEDVIDQDHDLQHGILPDGEYQPSNDDLGKSIGEIAGGATGIPGGAATGKVAGETAVEVQSAAAESVGQSTDVPTEAAEEVANEAPATDANEPDQEQYYSYGH